MKNIDERNNNNSQSFDSLPIGQFFRVVSNGKETTSIYIKLSNDFLPTSRGNAWSVDHRYYCSFNKYDIVQKLNVKMVTSED